MEKKEQPVHTKQNRRRQYYIKRRFQRRFILQFSWLIVVACAGFGLAIYLYSTQTLTTAFVNSKLRIMSTADFLLPALAFMTLMVTTLAASLAAFRLLLFSHKIAGPLYRLEQTAQAIGSGNLNLQVRVRSDDELQDFARSLDEMVKDLRAKALAIKSQNQRLREIIDRVGQVSTVPSDLIQALRDTQNRLDEATSHFQA